MHCQELHLDNFKGDFHIIIFLFAPSDSRYLNSYRPNVVLASIKSLFFSFEMIYKSTFPNIDPCGFVFQGHICDMIVL